jgi:hypothetical protein
MLIHLTHVISHLIKLSFNTPKFTRDLDVFSMRYRGGLIISYYPRLAMISNHVFLYVYAVGSWLGKKY